MKYTLTLTECTKAEIENVLNNLEGKVEVTVAATAPAKEVKVADPNDLNAKTKPELQALCDSRALKYAGRATKKDLIDLLEGRTQPVIEAAPVAAVVEEAPLVVPAAMTTAINEAPAVAQEAQAIDVAALIAQFTDLWNQTLAAGYSEQDMQARVATHVANLGHADTRLSLLPPETLAQFVGIYRADVGQLLQPAAAAPAQPNAFI